MNVRESLGSGGFSWEPERNGTLGVLLLYRRTSMVPVRGSLENEVALTV